MSKDSKPTRHINLLPNLQTLKHNKHNQKLTISLLWKSLITTPPRRLVFVEIKNFSRKTPFDVTSWSWFGDQRRWCRLWGHCRWCRLWRNVSSWEQYCRFRLWGTFSFCCFLLFPRLRLRAANRQRTFPSSETKQKKQERTKLIQSGAKW